MHAEAENGSRVAKLVVYLCEKYDRALTTILVGNNAIAVASSTVATILFYNILKGYGLENYASLIASIGMTIIVYILGDTLPKTIAKAIPDTTSKIVAYPINFLMFILFPITIIFEGLVKLIEMIFKPKNEDVFTSDDLGKVLEEQEDEGTLEEETVEIIQSALEFAEAKVKDVLTPRRKIFAIDITNLDVKKLNETLKTTNYSRIPVYEKTLDNYLGVLHVKTYIKDYLKNPKLNIRDILQKPYVVSSKVSLVNLLNGFKEHHTHLAMVINNDNKIIGMVTMEDVLEELVSDISEPNSYLKGVASK